MQDNELRRIRESVAKMSKVVKSAESLKLEEAAKKEARESVQPGK